MSDINKSNDNQHYQNSNGQILLPLPPENVKADDEMEIYARFMGHLRVVPNQRIEMKILSAIQFTADLLIQSDEYVAKVLVDLGLRAPKQSFPESYVQFLNLSYTPNKWNVETKIDPIDDLIAFWGRGKSLAQTSFAHQSNQIDIQSAVY